MFLDNVSIGKRLAFVLGLTSGVQRTAAIAKSSDDSLIAYFALATAASIKETNELQKFIEAQMRTPEERQLFDKVGELRTS